jgi:hypothetical protein
MPTPPVRDEREQDELDELPPLDDEAAPAAEADVGELLEEERGDASLDDSTGEDAPADGEELDVNEAEGGWLEEPADAPDLELGDVGMVELADLGGEDLDEPGVEGQDFGLVEGPEHGGLDGGDEGPVAEDEELREEDLPNLDADDEGDMQDAALVEAGFAADEPAGLPWAAQPWSRVGAPVPLVSATALACAARGALVAGRSEGGAVELVRVDLEGASEALPAEGLEVARVRALEVQGDTVMAWVDGGEARVSLDGGARFQPAERAETADASLARTLEDIDAPEARAPAVTARRGSHVAYAARRGGVVRRAADGSWKTCPWGGSVTALAFVDDRGTLLAATYSDADDTTALVRLDEQGRASVVARIGANRADPESDGRVLAMAHDAAHEVVWLAGGFGVAAFAVA